MFLTAHASAALWVTTKTADPLLAFTLGFVSHFILDIIPHGDETLGDHISDKKKKYLYLARIALVDVIVATAMIWLYVVRKPEIARGPIAIAVFASWLPDFLWLANSFLKWKFLTAYTRVHNRIHRLIDYRYSPVYGVPFQIIFTIMILKVMF